MNLWHTVSISLWVSFALIPLRYLPPYPFLSVNLCLSIQSVLVSPWPRLSLYTMLLYLPVCQTIRWSACLSSCVSEWVSEWASERVSEWVSQTDRQTDRQTVNQPDHPASVKFGLASIPPKQYSLYMIHNIIVHWLYLSVCYETC